MAEAISGGRDLKRPRPERCRCDLHANFGTGIQTSQKTNASILQKEFLFERRHVRLAGMAKAISHSSWHGAALPGPPLTLHQPMEQSNQEQDGCGVATPSREALIF